MLVLFQTSFLVHLNVAGIIPNLILIIVFLLNLLEKAQKNDGIFGAAISGFFWDIFSEKFIGFHILILISLAILIKLILKRYVRIQIIKRA